MRVCTLAFLVLISILLVKYYFGGPSRTYSTTPTADELARFFSDETILAELASRQTNSPADVWASKPSSALPVIYVVTATYRRPEQQAELTRLAQTLMHVPNIRWLLVEHANQTSLLVSQLLKKWKIPSVHMSSDWSPLPPKLRWTLKGSNCKNLALNWIRENATDNGVLYFADDDNTYDIELFEEMRSTKKVAMWPVGLVTTFGMSSPIVKDSKLIGFYDGWNAGRKFPIDMAGFAVNVGFFKQRPKASMSYRIGYHEDSFLRSLAPFDMQDIELKANNCTEILVWHTRSQKYRQPKPVDTNKYANTNLIDLQKLLVI